MAKITVVHKKSTLEFYSKSPDKDVRDYVAGGSVFARDIIGGAEAHERSLDIVVNSLIRLGENIELVYRGDLPKMPKDQIKELFGREVVSVGGDGTTIETSHYINDPSQPPLFVVNSDPQRSVGFYSTATAEDFERLFAERDKLPITNVPRIEVDINGQKIPELVLNDILIAHELPVATSRYNLIADGKEVHAKPPKNSGLLICTPSGYTGWMIKLGGKYLPLDAKKIQFCGRDNFETPRLADEISVLSLMRRGKAYVDGDYNVYPFGLNAEMKLRMGTPLAVYGTLEERRSGIILPLMRQHYSNLLAQLKLAEENLRILTGNA